MNRQDKIIREYVSELLLQEARLNEGFLDTLKKGAKGVGGSLMSIFKKRGGSELSWAEKAFEKFKQEAGEELTKRTQGKLVRVLDRFFSDEMLSGVPPEFLNVLKQALVGLYTPNARFSTSKERGETTKEAIEDFTNALETLSKKKNTEIAKLDQEDINYALDAALERAKWKVEGWERKAKRRKHAKLGLGRGSKDKDDEDIEDREEPKPAAKPPAKKPAAEPPAGGKQGAAQPSKGKAS